MDKAILACLSCMQTCNWCAAECIRMADAGHVACVEKCLDCASVCTTCAAFLSRGSSFGKPVMMLCAEICTACAEECEKHAQHHDHCRICAETCRACAEACRA